MVNLLRLDYGALVPKARHSGNLHEGYIDSNKKLCLSSSTGKFIYSSNFNTQLTHNRTTSSRCARTWPNGLDPFKINCPGFFLSLKLINLRRNQEYGGVFWKFFLKIYFCLRLGSIVGKHSPRPLFKRASLPHFKNRREIRCLKLILSPYQCLGKANSWIIL